MDISVDGHVQPLNPLPRTIGVLLDELRTSAAREHRVILSVRVDGADVDINAQRRIATEPTSRFSAVAVETADAKSLCVATLDEASRHIQPVIDEAARLSDLLDAGRESEALARISPCLEILGTIIAAVEKVSILLELDLHEVAHDGSTLAEVVGRLTDFLRDLKKSIEDRDLVAVRDSMKHELPGVADSLAQQLTALSSVVAAS